MLVQGSGLLLVGVAPDRCIQYATAAAKQGSVVAGGKGSRTKLVNVVSTDTVSKDAKPKNAKALAAVHQKKSVASALDLLKQGNNTDAEKLLLECVAQAGVFCATVAGEDGSPHRADKSAAVKFHDAAASTVDGERGHEPLGLDDPVAVGDIVAVDALQRLIALGTCKMLASSIAERLKRLIVELFLRCLVVVFVFDKSKLVPEAKGIEQQRRTGQVSYPNQIAHASLLQRALDGDSEVDLSMYLSNRLLREVLVEFVAGCLGAMRVPHGKTLVIDCSNGVSVYGAPLPANAITRLSALCMGEADITVFAHLVVLSEEMPALHGCTSWSTDADGFGIGLLARIRFANRETGQLPANCKWHITFTANISNRRRYCLDTLFTAIASGQVRPSSLGCCQSLAPDVY